MKRLLAGLLLPVLVACAGAPKKPATETSAAPAEAAAAKPADIAAPGKRKVSPYAPAQEDPNTRGHYTAGGLYRPGVPDSTPDYVPDVDLIPEPEVVAEPRSRVGNRASYSVLGKEYRVLEDASGYVEQGLASYYGSKFHGRRTSNLEVYDMNAFTAAHKTLPLPSFARITNLDNGRSVVVRVNDRGPFHEGRVVDLSYAAAVKLGITQRGTGRVEVRALLPGDDAPAYAATTADRAPAATAPAMPTPASHLDTLLAALPVASAQAGSLAGSRALVLPPGVRIATGKPTRLDRGTSAPSAASDSVPVADPAIAGTSPILAPDASPASQDWRFDMHQDGKAMSADEFDAWMRRRQVSVATGRQAPPIATPAAIPAIPAGEPAPAVMVAAAAESPTATGHQITLQVASFAARSNADRSLSMLQAAGIAQSRLIAGNVDAQQVWRLRVGPLPLDEAARVSERIVSLGFGPPQQVRD